VIRVRSRLQALKSYWATRRNVKSAAAETPNRFPMHKFGNTRLALKRGRVDAFRVCIDALGARTGAALTQERVKRSPTFPQANPSCASCAGSSRVAGTPSGRYLSANADSQARIPLNHRRKSAGSVLPTKMQSCPTDPVVRGLREIASRRWDVELMRSTCEFERLGLGTSESLT
jgi:hypothetical protein